MSERIVVDTNVFIAAVLSSAGSNRKVIRAFLEGKVIPIMRAALFHEYEDLLSRNDLMQQSPICSEERDTLYAAFLSVSEWIRVYFLWRPNLPDAGDDHLIELAVAGGAGAIVTNNLSDLRGGEPRFPYLKILTPNQFLKSLS